MFDDRYIDRQHPLCPECYDLDFDFDIDFERDIKRILVGAAIGVTLIGLGIVLFRKYKHRHD